MARVVPTEGDTHDAEPVVVTQREAASNDEKVDATTRQRTAPETQDSDPHAREPLPASPKPPHDLSLDPSQAAACEENQPSAVKDPTTVPGESDNIQEADDNDDAVGPEPGLKSSSRVAAAGEEERVQQSQPVGGNFDGVASIVPKSGADSLQVSEMDKHRGMTTFSLAHPHTDSSAAKSGPTQVSIAEAENDLIGEGSTRRPTEPSDDQSQEDDEEESEPRGFQAIARRGTRRFIPRHSQGSRDDGGGASSTINRKRAPFRVPQTMFMGHPVGSTAAQFLERQKHRVQDVTSKREKASCLMKLVMEHSAAATGSPLPDIDIVFPDDRSDHDQGDRCV